MDSFSGSFIKFLVFLFNLLFVVFGILLIVLGFMVEFNTARFAGVLNGLLGPAVILIIIGFGVFLMAFLACCGAFTESYCLLMTFSSIVTLIVITEVVALVFIYQYRRDIDESIADGIEKLIHNHPQNSTENSDIDGIQEELGCCGARGASDWFKAFPNESLPDSCCGHLAKGEKCDMGLAFPGCQKAIENIVSEKLVPLIGVVVGFIGIQVVSIIFSCCLAQNIKKEYHRFV